MKTTARPKSMPTVMYICLCFVIGICLLLAGALLFSVGSHALASRGLTLASGTGTTLDFVSTNVTETGFNRETTMYTENGITDVAFSGSVTVEGTAEISVVSDDGNVFYRETYSDADARAIRFTVTGLAPYSYYTLRFSSDDAKRGDLSLTSDQSLVKRPERHSKSTPATPN